MRGIPGVPESDLRPLRRRRQFGRNAKSDSTTVPASTGFTHTVGEPPPLSPQAGSRTNRASRSGATIFMPREPIGPSLSGRAPGPRDDRVGYHRCMAQAAQIEPSRPLPVAAGEAVRMALRTTAVDAVGLEERAASLAKRSIKTRCQALGA